MLCYHFPIFSAKFEERAKMLVSDLYFESRSAWRRVPLFIRLPTHALAQTCDYSTIVS